MSKPVSIWLFISAAMVLAMAVIGAITRLTESGLSMVEWRPLIGAIPPLSDAEWQRVFEIYKQTPEFIYKNSWMGLNDFKEIFFWEWFHRFWGRLIGLVYALPLLVFWFKGMIPHRFKLKLLFGLFLGGAQAVMGWYMVESGLVDVPYVSHYRLAAHLSLAFIIFGYLLWLAFDLWPRRYDPSALPASFCLKRHGWFSFGAIFITVVWGAFVAGKDAGLVYNTWPLMDKSFFPAGDFQPLTDHGWIQFTHRWIAALTMLIVLSFAWRGFRDFERAKGTFVLLGLSVIGQFILGIATLLSQVHLHVAATHQAGAFILAGLCLMSLFKLHKG